ncbi:hypothetical protein LC612_42910 [Nostoc sp. CHAB 5834]|nr:hypothetical protein [Nostoc sp. CHAB 5834]
MMTPKEFEQLNQARESVLTVDSLTDKSPRTLLYGYTTDRYTWHVYLNEYGKIVRLLTAYSGFILFESDEPPASNRDYIPSKRLYGESCDFEFCRLLKGHDVPLPFTTFSVNDDKARKEATGSNYASLTRDAPSLTPATYHPYVSILPVEIDKKMRKCIVDQAAADVKLRCEPSDHGLYLPNNGLQSVIERASELVEAAQKFEDFFDNSDPHTSENQEMRRRHGFSCETLYEPSFMGGFMTWELARTDRLLQQVEKKVFDFKQVDGSERAIQLEDKDGVAYLSNVLNRGEQKGLTIFYVRQLFGINDRLEKQLRFFLHNN